MPTLKSYSSYTKRQPTNVMRLVQAGLLTILLSGCASFKATCIELGIKHSFKRPYRPQTNGKAERFIQPAFREWAYGRSYQNSAHRTNAMGSWQHHYNWHRPHSGIGGLAPMFRLSSSRNNLLTLHT